MSAPAAPIDADRLLGLRPPPVPFGWRGDDVIRYHLALGAGSPECSGPELRYVYEDVLQVLGTFAAVPASAASAMLAAALGHDSAILVHGEQEVELHASLPVAADSINTARVVDVHDTGSGASVGIAVDTATVRGTVLARTTFRLLVPGAGGFGGDPPPRRPPGEPIGVADAVFTIATLPQQAALYRMTGDRTPVHIDPDVARSVGLPRPSLPGLCTWGMVAKALVDHELDGDAAALTGFAARFSGPVFPGETLEVSLWRRAGEFDLRARVLERNSPALSRGRARIG